MAVGMGGNNVAGADATALGQRFEPLGLRGAKVLGVASTGGHLAELVRLLRMVDASEDSLIVTFDSPQAIAVARHYRTTFVPYVKPRDLLRTATAARRLREVVGSERFDVCLTTGAAVGAAAFTLGRRVPRVIYVESFSRFDGPSLTGRIARAAPRVETYTQQPGWRSRFWPYVGNVLERTGSETETSPGADAGTEPILFVTLGTIHPYRFDSLVDHIKALPLPDDWTIRWQLGVTTRVDLPGEAAEFLDGDEFREAVAQATVVVSHAGVGTMIDLVERKKPAVIVPRRRSRGEHVDDHQLQLCEALGDINPLLRHREVDDITVTDLLELRDLSPDDR